MAKAQKCEQAPQRSPEELAKLLERQRTHQEDIDSFNAEFSRPGAWTIGKELGGEWLAAGIVKSMATHGPRKEADEKPWVGGREDSRQNSAKLATNGGKTTRLSMLFLPLFAT